MKSKPLIIFFTFFVVGIGLYILFAEYLGKNTKNFNIINKNSCIQNNEIFCKIKIDNNFIKSQKTGTSSYKFSNGNTNYNCEIIYETDSPYLLCKKY